MFTLLNKALFPKKHRRKLEEKKQAKQWNQVNFGKTLFFFPMKQRIQEIIFEKVVPFVDRDIDFVFYNGPKVICTLDPLPERYFLKNAYYSNSGFKLGSASIIQVAFGKLILRLDLPELSKCLDEGFDFESVIHKINVHLNEECTFQVNSTFKITGRGTVLSGDILEGRVSVGNRATINNQEYRIKGVEVVDRRGEDLHSEVGLIVDLNDNEERDRLSAFLKNHPQISISS